MMSILVKDMLLSILHISLAMLSIIIISLLLAVNPTVSLLSLGAVAATIVDTAGFAYFWDLTIDPFLAVIFKRLSLAIITFAFTSNSGVAVHHCRHHSGLCQPCWSELPYPGFDSLPHSRLPHLNSEGYQQASQGLCVSCKVTKPGPHIFFPQF